jgi:hypothetical protein
MKFKFILVMALLFMPLSRNFHAVSDINSAQALFIYNFLSHIKWPEEAIGSKYVIGVLGTTTTSKYLEKFTTNKKIGMRSIEVKSFPSITSLSNCQVLLVANSQSKEINTVTQKLQGKSCLIIGEKEGLTKEGAVIDFSIVEGKLRFKINEQNAVKQNLIISSSLLQMAAR